MPNAQCPVPNAEMIKALQQSYPSRYGTPVLNSVDTEIFVQGYFAQCMDCTFCHDSCCAYGVDVDALTVGRLLAHADDLEPVVGVGRERWFTGEYNTDPEIPGGSYTRTAVIDGACVFLNRQGRGCLIHKFCLDRGLDVHDLKPMIASLFPVTFDYGMLHANAEVRDKTLICYNTGPSLYRSARADLEYYFGPELIAELDALEAEVRANPPATAPAPTLLSLPVLPPE
jgi:Fe-S-cluster containining protein